MPCRVLSHCFRAGYASSCEAYGGFRYLNGYADRAPVRPNISLGDTVAGLHAAFGVVMALLHRQRGGAGQVVDAAISESMFNMLEGCVPEFAAKGLVRGPSGSTVSGLLPCLCVFLDFNFWLVFVRIFSADVSVYDVCTLHVAVVVRPPVWQQWCHR